MATGGVTEASAPVPVRALTLGLAAEHPVASSVIEGAARQVQGAARMVSEAGYSVQTVRLAMRPLLGGLRPSGGVPLLAGGSLGSYLDELHAVLTELGIEFCSLGPVPGELAPARAEALADLVAPMPELNWSVMVASPGAGPDWEAALTAGRVMSRLARTTERGLGNFNFAATACVPPATPFFPAAYQGPGREPVLSIALQGARIVAGALDELRAHPGARRQLVPEAVSVCVRQAMELVAGPIVDLVRQAAGEAHLQFAGIDLSPAPDVDDSICGALETLGLGPFGGPGSLALCAAVTTGIRSTALPTCGYNGLMLPVMEDAVLAQRWGEGRFGLDQLLAWSAVCGTGLDTVPVPGETPAEELALVVMDMASLAARYSKPLSARLMPVPGALAGDMADFGSPYLVRTLVKSVTPGP
ncbi:MAG TPA: DUF711 family protein [Acidimicrobiales bacterium]|nr:DUF711 family protein [Acidimicrobiales bacterium]